MQVAQAQLRQPHHLSQAHKHLLPGLGPHIWAHQERVDLQALIISLIIDHLLEACLEERMPLKGMVVAQACLPTA